MIQTNKIYQDDCIDILKDIDAETVDLILVDPPYGTTAAAWDKVLPMRDYISVGKTKFTLEDYLISTYKKGISYQQAVQTFEEQKTPGLWTHYERIIKPEGAIVIFGSEPFSTQLRASNPKLYKYDWIWQKTSVDGFFNAQCRPLKTVEMISVFSKAEARAKGNNMKYYPQGLIPIEKQCKEARHSGESDGHKYYRESIAQKEYVQKFTNYPTEILKFSRDTKKIHPTQKPVDLLEYLIKTYTDEGDLVLDNCMGSGSTVVAAINTNRYYIGIEQDPKYFAAAQWRIKILNEC